MYNVSILLYDGFDELDAIGPYEVFRTAAGFGADCDVRLVTLDERETVTANHGMEVVVGGQLDPESSVSTDLILVPGGGWSDATKPGAGMEAKKGDIPGALAAFSEFGMTVAGVCTGGMLLARAGLLEDRPAVTHHSALSDLEDAGAKVRDARFVDDGDVLTAGGVTSGIDLALHVVEREFGSDIAAEVAREIEYDRRKSSSDAVEVDRSDD
ncbi:DJ-1/PfpI family protein [Halopelagius longus]|uniref:DJ-1/PfpI family protein n=1 Tax=Halopelagius longus TaxID=1236180 RepID=A0A1H0ZE68_9EURY|nr:DJ-1/PfpI family protein [Halopelagius longus]RDI72954.1 DJ-1/PfpI family protein [Halopelagius longus]SDQ25451.1 DJ-1/PfpI family protein [Halopelagius longus]